jgi:hypothetical protein
MRFFKVFELGMWRVHALDGESGSEHLLPMGAIQISSTEAEQLRQVPSSEEFLNSQAAGVSALGGRNMAKYPSREFKEAIGHICVNSASIEVTLRACIWQAAGVTAEVGMAFTGGTNSIDQLLKTLETLLTHSHPHLIDAYKPLSRRLQALNVARGKYVHSLWHPSHDGVTISKYLLTRSHNDSRVETVTLDTLYDVAEGFMTIEGEMMNALLFPLIPKSS